MYSPVAKTLRITESAYHALKAHKQAGETHSDVIVRLTGGEEKSVCDFLRTLNPAIRNEIVESVKTVKSELDHGRPRKDCRATRTRLHRPAPTATSRPAG